MKRLWRRFLLQRVAVEDRALLMLEHKHEWRDPLDVLRALDTWSTGCCSEGCTSDSCCDWQRLRVQLLSQPGLVQRLDKWDTQPSH